MRTYTKSVLALAVASIATPVFADLVVTQNLGTLNSGVSSLTGTTVGQANNAFVYTSTTNATTGTTVWGNGEYVYQFQLTKPAFLYMTDIAEPDADGSFPDPNHDYFLLNTLTTFNSDNLATSSTNPNFPSFVGKPEGTSVALVQETMLATTAGSSANNGIFRSAAANPRGVFAAGIYYVAVDSRSGSVNSHGLANALPAGNFTGKLNVAYVDEVAKPAASAANTVVGGQVSGAYTPGAVIWNSFVYDGSALSLTTEGNTLNESGGDTFLAVYDAEGALIKFNDDVSGVGGPSWSGVSFTAGELVTGATYYVGLTEYKAIANSGFGLSVMPSAVGASGTYVINGLSPIPEPTSAMLVAGGLAALAARRRRR